MRPNSIGTRDTSSWTRSAPRTKRLLGGVLVVGAGGLGSPAIQYLAAAGIGRLGIVDDDVVERSNLQRQIVHGDADVGRPKVESAADYVTALNPDVDVEPTRRGSRRRTSPASSTTTTSSSTPATTSPRGTCSTTTASSRRRRSLTARSIVSRARSRRLPTTARVRTATGVTTGPTAAGVPATETASRTNRHVTGVSFPKRPNPAPSPTVRPLASSVSSRAPSAASRPPRSSSTSSGKANSSRGDSSCTTRWR